MASCKETLTWLGYDRSKETLNWLGHNRIPFYCPHSASISRSTASLERQQVSHHARSTLLFLLTCSRLLSLWARSERAGWGGAAGLRRAQYQSGYLPLTDRTMPWGFDAWSRVSPVYEDHWSLGPFIPPEALRTFWEWSSKDHLGDVASIFPWRPSAAPCTQGCSLILADCLHRPSLTLCWLETIQRVCVFTLIKKYIKMGFFPPHFPQFWWHHLSGTSALI